MSMETISSVHKTIALDFAQKTSPVTVFAKQGDENTRLITIQPLMNGVPVAIDRDPHYAAKFAAKKPDGKFVYNDSASITNEGFISVVLSDQTLAAHGNAICCVILTNEETQQTLTSQNFTLIIEYSAGAYKNLASSDEIVGLDEKLAQVQALIDALGDEIKVLPESTPEDKGKVLAVDEDGEPVWQEPTGGAEIHEVTSPDEITEDSPDGIYMVEGGSGGGGGSGGTTIRYYDSISAVPANLPEGSFVAVPSTGESGGGLPVVELSEDFDIANPVVSEADAAKLDAVLAHDNIFIRYLSDLDEIKVPILMPMAKGVTEGGVTFTGATGMNFLLLGRSDEEGWVAMGV